MNDYLKLQRKKLRIKTVFNKISYSLDFDFSVPQIGTRFESTGPWHMDQANYRSINTDF